MRRPVDDERDQAGPTTELLAVGKVVKPFGVRGEVVVQSFTDSPARFRKLTRIYAGSDAASARPVVVRCTSVDPRGARLSFAGVNDRTAAGRLVGTLLFVDGSQRAALPRGRYYVHEIVGLRVEEESGTPLGTVQEVLKYPAHDVYVIRGEKGEILVPAVKAFVRSIDITRHLMRVRLIEGMVEG